MMRASAPVDRRVLETAFAKRLTRSIRDALAYLCQHVQDDGRFDYVYDPINDRVGHEYNLLRHAGTTMELYRFVGSAFDGGSVATVADRSWEYLRHRITHVNRDGQECACLADAHIAKLGGTALMLLALCERTMPAGASTEDIVLTNRLAHYILSQQRADGTFVSKAFVSTNRPIDFESVYYPGEAVLALCYAYRLTHERDYLKRAVLGAQALMRTTSCRPEASGRYADHWFMKSLAELHILSPDPAWASWLRSMAEPMLSTPSQAGDGSVPVHWLVDSSTTNLSTRVEALLAALCVDLEMGDRQHACKTLDYAQVGLALCLKRQICCNNEGKKYPRAIGGFRQSTTGSEIRIDYIHHPLGASLSFLHLEKILVPQLNAGAEQTAADFRADSTVVEAILSAVETCETQLRRESPYESIDPEGTGLSWRPDRQIIYHKSHVFVHKGPTNTDPSHDLAHLLLAASGGLGWLPVGEIDDVRVAEYNAVFLENLFHNSHACIVFRSIEPNAILPLTIKYVRWFVEKHFAPFPLTAEEAYRQFCWGLNAAELTKLSPMFFYQKQNEQHGDYKKKQWDIPLPVGDYPNCDPAAIEFQALVSEQFRSMTRADAFPNTDRALE
jgi:hypothetical protein